MIRRIGHLVLTAVCMVSVPSFATNVNAEASSDERQVQNVSLGDVEIEADVTRNLLHFTDRDGQEHVFPMSSGLPQYPTHLGDFTGPFRLTGPDATPPFGIFYKDGFGIYGTLDINRVGQPATHGGIRLRMRDAKRIQAEVRQRNDESVRIIIHE